MVTHDEHQSLDGGGFKPPYTAPSQQTSSSGLLALPTELRITIYTFIFADTARLHECGETEDSKQNRGFGHYNVLPKQGIGDA